MFQSMFDLQGAIFSICCMSDGKILSGGGKHRKIVEWNQYLQKTGQEMEVKFNLTLLFPEFYNWLFPEFYNWLFFNLLGLFNIPRH